jgi:hypothetical protein
MIMNPADLKVGLDVSARVGGHVVSGRGKDAFHQQFLIKGGREIYGRIIAVVPPPPQPPRRVTVREFARNPGDPSKILVERGEEGLLLRVTGSYEYKLEPRDITGILGPVPEEAETT